MSFLRYIKYRSVNKTIMKDARRFLTLILSFLVAFVAFGQELDDMYFNSKDRAKLNEGKISADIGLSRSNGKSEAKTPINPTDSYSARNINPEYNAQLNHGAAPIIEDNYFIPDYQPTGVNQNLYNCNCGSGSFYNPYYGNNAFNNPYYGYTGGFGSPYSSFYPSAWGYPYNRFGSGLNMSLGYGWGGFSPGYYGGLGYGMGGYANNFWNPYNSWGSGYYNPYYYPSQVIVINNSDAYGRKVSYSKRSSRSSTLNHDIDNSRYNSSPTVTGNSRTNVTNGRSRSATPEYYDRSWKRSQNEAPTRSYWNNMNSTGNTSRSSFNGNTNTGGRTSSGYVPPSRNSFNSGATGGGSRSSGSSGSSSGSKTRGRNN